MFLYKKDDKLIFLWDLKGHPSWLFPMIITGGHHKFYIHLLEKQPVTYLSDPFLCYTCKCMNKCRQKVVVVLQIAQWISCMYSMSILIKQMSEIPKFWQKVVKIISSQFIAGLVLMILYKKLALSRSIAIMFTTLKMKVNVIKDK